MAESKRVHIISMTARNIKSLRCVEINEFGDVTEIRGDTGQGKTSILEAIEGGLMGLDASMVRKGADSGEIILELDVARVQRIINAADGKNTVTVTNRETGRPIEKAKDFLRAIMGDQTVFHPLDFVMLGGGESKGKTERLRRQRNMLLDALPCKMERKHVEKFLAEMSEAAREQAKTVVLDHIDFEQHALSVCEALEKEFYEARKFANGNADDAKARLKVTDAPIGNPVPVAEADAKLTAARKALYGAQAAVDSQRATMDRRDKLQAQIDAEAKAVEAEGDFNAEFSIFTGEVSKIEKEIEELEAKLAALREKRRVASNRLAQIAAIQARAERLQSAREELAKIEASLASVATHDINGLTAAMQEAEEALMNATRAERYLEALAKANEAEGVASALTDLVVLFRDTLPKRIIDKIKMPVEGLGVTDGVVTHNGIPLHQLGTSEQLRIAVLVAAALSPRNGFILIDRAESLGTKDKMALALAAKEIGLQLILTFVDPGATPKPGTIVMENGESVS